MGLSLLYWLLRGLVGLALQILAGMQTAWPWFSPLALLFSAALTTWPMLAICLAMGHPERAIILLVPLRLPCDLYAWWLFSRAAARGRLNRESRGK